MNLIEYFIIAIIQGLTEPLPISSSGHMLLFKNIFSTNMFNNLNYEIICNFGSFIAILIIFWKDIIKLISDFFIFIFNKEKRKDTKAGFWYCINVVISTLPLVLTGLLFKDYIESKASSMYFLGFAFLFTSLALFIVRKINGKKDDYHLTIKDALIIGLFQGLTFIPGLSRSGTVLVACLLVGLNRESSLKYTFILYFPVSVGSLVLDFSDIVTSLNNTSLYLPYTIGLIVSGVITYFTYEWMAKWVKNGKLIYFSIYTLILSIFIFIFFR